MKKRGGEVTSILGDEKRTGEKRRKQWIVVLSLTWPIALPLSLIETQNFGPFILIRCMDGSQYVHFTNWIIAGAHDNTPTVEFSERTGTNTPQHWSSLALFHYSHSLESARVTWHCHVTLSGCVGTVGHLAPAARSDVWMYEKKLTTECTFMMTSCWVKYTAPKMHQLQHMQTVTTNGKRSNN